MFQKFEVRPISISETGEVTPFSSYAEAQAYANENDGTLSFGLYGREEDGCWVSICDTLTKCDTFTKDDMIEMLCDLFGKAPVWNGYDQIMFDRTDVTM
jgi:hypothetical protein